MKVFNSIRIDMTCSYCKENLKRIKSFDLDKDDNIVLRPDINYAGVIICYHINIVKKGQELK